MEVDNEIDLSRSKPLRQYSAPSSQKKESNKRDTERKERSNSIKKTKKKILKK